MCEPVQSQPSSTRMAVHRSPPLSGTSRYCAPVRARGVGLLLAATLAVAGCADESTGGEPLPPVSPTVSSAPPVSAFPETPQGRSAFARFVYEEIARAYRLGDPELLRPLFAEACVACQNFLRSLEQVRAGDVTVEGGGSTVLGADSPGDEMTVIVRLRYEGVTFRNRAGAVTAREEPAELQDEVMLEYTNGRYRVVGIVGVNR